MFSSISDSTHFSDSIRDFQQGTDRIDVSAIDANTGLGGNQAFAFTGAYDGSVNPGEIYTFVTGGWTYVYLNVTGGDPAESAFAIQGSYALNASDFIL
ncbi:MAG TPA: M10 family metallopeptidase C-terminal domain-containing protein [Geminicoccaceae bacterium]|nr:M10 family metallopeptidase C-terminal domain-containing protein [Geminicoccaceae bacterium]